MKTNLSLQEFLQKKLISTKYLSKISGVSYGMLRRFAIGYPPPEYHIPELNKAIKQIAEQLNSINITNDQTES